MDWNDLLVKIIMAVVGAALTALSTMATAFITTKIKNEKLKALLSGALTIVQDGVNYTYQTFVEEIKGTDGWTEEAKNAAVEKALAYIKTNLSAQAQEYVKSVYGDVDVWAREQIEIAIKKSKDQTV